MKKIRADQLMRFTEEPEAMLKLFFENQQAIVLAITVRYEKQLEGLSEIIRDLNQEVRDLRKKLKENHEL